MRKQDDSFQTNLLVFHPRMVVETMDYHNNLDYERVALVLEIVQHINYYLNRSVSDYSMDSADNYSMVVEYQDFGLSHHADAPALRGNHDSALGSRRSGVAEVGFLR